MANQYTTRFPERFWEKVEKTEYCWIWIARKNHHGYGEFTFNGKVWKSHRLSYFLSNGDFDKSLYVCHTCDNPSCVRPDHLFLASQKSNMIDMVDKKRHGNQKGVQSYDEWLSIRPNKSIKDLCSAGHEFSYNNTRIKKRGTGYARLCRTCQYENSKKDIVLYKVNSFVRGVPNRASIVREIVDKVYSCGVKCWYCGGPFECLDHQIPKKRGGEISPSNINPSCNDCNQKRKSLYA